jgi:hypothetical protein
VKARGSLNKAKGERVKAKVKQRNSVLTQCYSVVKKFHAKTRKNLHRLCLPEPWRRQGGTEEHRVSQRKEAQGAELRAQSDTTSSRV